MLPIDKSVFGLSPTAARGQTRCLAAAADTAAAQNGLESSPQPLCLSFNKKLCEHFRKRNYSQLRQYVCGENSACAHLAEWARHLPHDPWPGAAPCGAGMVRSCRYVARAVPAEYH